MLEPIHFGDTLWRYTKISTLLLLLEGKAWLPSVASLRADDPLEGALGEEFYPELGSMLAAHSEFDDAEQWLCDNLSPPDKGLLKINPNDASLRTQILAKAYWETLARLRAVWCWFKSDIESAAMWSIYGNRGVAIRTDRQRLEKALPRDTDFNIQEMAYVDRRPCSTRSIHFTLRDNPDLIRKPYFLKALEYEHEKELRVAVHCPGRENGVMLTSIDSEKLIREIVISPLFPQDEAEALKKMISAICPSAKVHHSRLLPHSKRAIGGFDSSLREWWYAATDDRIKSEDHPKFLMDL